MTDFDDTKKDTEPLLNNQDQPQQNVYGKKVTAGRLSGPKEEQLKINQTEDSNLISSHAVSPKQHENEEFEVKLKDAVRSRASSLASQKDLKEDLKSVASTAMSQIKDPIKISFKNLNYKV